MAHRDDQVFETSEPLDSDIFHIGDAGVSRVATQRVTYTNELQVLFQEAPSEPCIHVSGNKALRSSLSKFRPSYVPL